jgi:hypothetical protein
MRGSGLFGFGPEFDWGHRTDSRMCLLLRVPTRSPKPPTTPGWVHWGLKLLNHSPDMKPKNRRRLASLALTSFDHCSARSDQNRLSTGSKAATLRPGNPAPSPYGTYQHHALSRCGKPPGNKQSHSDGGRPPRPTTNRKWKRPRSQRRWGQVFFGTKAAPKIRRAADIMFVIVDHRRI